MQPDAAIEKYKERRVRDAQAPVGATDFDELDASDSDDDLTRRYANHERYARSGLLERARDLQFDARHGFLTTDPNEDLDGDTRLGPHSIQINKW